MANTVRALGNLVAPKAAANEDGDLEVIDVDGNLKVAGTFNVGDVSVDMGPTNVLLGPVTETAPASDTASSGLNGRLQRIAQRLSTLIGILPPSLDADGGLKVHVQNPGGGGGGGAVTVADGADVAQGTTTDAEATGNGTVIAILKRIRTLLGGTLSTSVTNFPATQPVSGTVTANIGTTNGVALETTQGTGNTRLGDLTETAPSMDTASSGLNGRLQRIAQRLTSLIALFPAALTGSGNFKVALQETIAVPITDNGGSVTVDGTVGVNNFPATQPISATALPLPTGGTLVDGTLAATTTAAALGSQACKSVMVQADPDNVADCFLGDATNQRFQLVPGQAASLPVSNANQVYAKMASGSGNLNWLAIT